MAKPAEGERWRGDASFGEREPDAATWLGEWNVARGAQIVRRGLATIMRRGSTRKALAVGVKRNPDLLALTPIPSGESSRAPLLASTVSRSDSRHSFFKGFGAGALEYDLVLTYPLDGNEERRKRRSVLLARLNFIGLKVETELSRDEDEVFVKITSAADMMLETAERIGMEKKLKSGGYEHFSRDKFILFEPANVATGHFFTSLPY